jgi:hypothetical protein
MTRTGAYIFTSVVSVFIGVVWILSWLRSPWPVVGWVVGSLVLSVPFWIAAFTWRRHE